MKSDHDIRNNICFLCYFQVLNAGKIKRNFFAKDATKGWWQKCTEQATKKMKTIRKALLLETNQIPKHTKHNIHQSLCVYRATAAIYLLNLLKLWQQATESKKSNNLFNINNANEIQNVENDADFAKERERILLTNIDNFHSYD